MTCSSSNGPTDVQVLATLPGDQPRTSLRVLLVHCDHKAHVRLEHRAYSDDLGWYTQKSFHLPRATLPALARQFRFADALTRVMDETANESQATDREPIPFPGPCDGEEASPARQRRDA